MSQKLPHINAQRMLDAAKERKARAQIALDAARQELGHANVEYNVAIDAGAIDPDAPELQRAPTVSVGGGVPLTPSEQG